MGENGALRVGVVGVGYFGRFHAQKYAAMNACDLIAVADGNAERAAAVSEELQVEALSDHRDLLGRVDAVSITVPDAAHFPVARDFLSQGVHVLLEKPMTDNLDDADTLIEIARERNVILQVGHIERFSSAYLAVAEHIDRPLFIQSDRISPFDPRGLNTDVVLDLMIHDIDIIMALTGSPVESIDAVGAPVLSGREDIANSRIHFTNGCVANVTASRVGQKTERRIRIFQKDCLIVVDFVQGRLVRVVRGGKGIPVPGLPDFAMTEDRFEKGDSLRREVESFVRCVTTGAVPKVDGAAGRAALQTALQIRDSLSAHRERLHIDI